MPILRPHFLKRTPLFLAIFCAGAVSSEEAAYQYTSVHEFSLMDTQQQTDTVNDILNVLFNYHTQNELNEVNDCMVDLFMNTPLDSRENGYQLVFSHFTTAVVLPLEQHPRMEDLVANIVGENCRG